MTQETALPVFGAILVGAFSLGAATFLHESGHQRASRLLFGIAALFLAPPLVRLWLAVVL